METVQDAVRRTVFESYLADGSHVPAKAIAADMNLSIGTLYDIADETRERKLRAEEIVPLIRAAHGNFAVLDVIERALGRIAFSVPSSGRPGEVLALSAESAQRFGQFLQDIVRFDADGVWTPDEVERAKRRRDQLFAVVSAAIEQAERYVVEKGRVA